MCMNTETGLIMKPLLNGCRLIYSLLRLEYTTRYLPRFSTDLQSGEVDVSYQRSEPVCRFELTESIENRLT